MATTQSAIPEHCNEVRLVGRVAAEPLVTVLPSGDQVITTRLIINRPLALIGRGNRAGVDTVPCAAWSSTARKRVQIWHTGDIVEVNGALRRRFWRGPDGPRSRFEVEVSGAKRLQKTTTITAGEPKEETAKAASG